MNISCWLHSQCNSKDSQLCAGRNLSPQLKSAEMCFPMQLLIVITLGCQRLLQGTHFYIFSACVVTETVCYNTPPPLKRDQQCHLTNSSFCRNNTWSLDTIQDLKTSPCCQDVTHASSHCFQWSDPLPPLGQDFVTPQCSLLWPGLCWTSCPSILKWQQIWSDQANLVRALRKKSLLNHQQVVEDCHASCPLFVCPLWPTEGLWLMSSDNCRAKGESNGMEGRTNTQRQTPAGRSQRLSVHLASIRPPRATFAMDFVTKLSVT